jgi:glucokinase
LERIRHHVELREEEAATLQFGVIPGGDMAGARGVAMVALDRMRS